MKHKDREHFFNDQRYYPNDPLDKALKSREQGRYHEALVYCDQALKLRPKEPSTYHLKSLCYEETNQHDKAIACIDQAIKYSGFPRKSKYLHIYLSMKLSYLHWANRYNEVIKLADKLIHDGINITNSYAYKGLSMHNLCAGSEDKDMLNKILYCYNKALEGNKNNILLDGKGKILCILEEYDDAISCFKEALSLDPDDGIMSEYDIMGGLATVLYKAGRYDEAVEQCKQVLKLDPKDPETLYSIACIFYNLGLMTESLDALNSATRSDPSFEDTENLRRDIMSHLKSS